MNVMKTFTTASRMPIVALAIVSAASILTSSIFSALICASQRGNITGIFGETTQCYLRCSKWEPVRSGNNTKEETTEDIFQQKEDTFVLDMKEFDAEDQQTNETVGILQQQEDILQPSQPLPDYYLLPRTNCVEWVVDTNQSPKLSFIDNTLNY